MPARSSWTAAATVEWPHFRLIRGCMMVPMWPPAPASSTLGVDLSIIAANARALRSRLPHGTAMLAAVKANAYGHGALAVATHLERERVVDMFGIATVGEGLELRAGGITSPILKLSHCFPDELPAAVAVGLTLTVVDEPTIRAASTAAADAGRELDVHLKVDTGMGRIGCRPDQAVALARLVADLPGLRLAGLFTHLPISDVDDDAGFTDAELHRFRALADDVEAAVGPIPFVHAANSGAILQHDGHGFTLARPGISLYGYYPDPTTAHTVELRQAIRWTTRLSFTKPVTAGTSIGYGRTWVAERDTCIGTIPIGYADGFSRHHSNRGHVLVNGRRVPVVGRVCMDQTMVDLGPEATDQVGDEVVLLGDQADESITTDEMAQLMGTITYEVTSLITPRVARTYRA